MLQKAAPKAKPGIIPPLPEVAVRLSQECQQETPSVDTVIRLIESDVALTTKVMEVSNSALFGYSRKINSIPRAAIVLGLRSISTIAMAAAAQPVFSGSGGACPVRKRLHKHSLACAVVSRIIAEETKTVDPNSAFLSGLLHDLGKLSFILSSDTSYANRLASADQQPSLDEEQMSFGLCHAQAGAHYIRKMNLPFDVSQGIADHHSSIHAEQPQLVQLSGVVALANHLSKIWFEGAKPNNEQLEPFLKLESFAKASFDALRCLS